MTPAKRILWLVLLVFGALLTCALVFLLEDRLVRSFVLFGAAAVAGGAALGWWALMLARRWISRIPAAGIAVGLVLLGATLMVGAGRIPMLQVLNMVSWDLHSVWRGICAYEERYGAFPADLHRLVEEGLVGERELHSPFRQHLTRDGIDYIYVSGLSPGDPSNWPIVFDLEDTHDDGTRMVLYVSGHIRVLTKRDFDVMIAEFAEAFKSRRGHPPVFVRNG